MSMKQCIKNIYDHGLINQSERADLEARYDALIKRGFDPKKAKDAILAEMDAEAFQRDRRAHIAETVRKERETELFAFRNRRGEQDVAEAYASMHDRLGIKEEAIIGEAMGIANKFLLMFEKGAIVGDKRRTSSIVGNKQLMIDMQEVKAVLFENAKASNPAVQAAADGLRDMFEYMRQMFNARGGAIAKLDGWGGPQGHDAALIQPVGMKAWVDYFAADNWKALNRERMINHATGIPLSDAELRAALEVAWKRITTEGWFDREVTAAPSGKGALYKQHQDHRFIHFRNAEEHTRYAREFGTPDFYEAVSRHIQSMARDIAAMEVFGPNPESMRAYLKNRATKHLETARSNNIVHAEMHDEIRRLTKIVNGDTPTPKAETLTATMDGKIAEILDTLGMLRDRGGRYDRGDKGKIRAMHAALAELEKAWAALFGTQTKTKSGDVAGVIADHIGDNDIPAVHLDTPEKIEAADRIRFLLDDMREEVILPSGNWQSRAERSLWLADSMWNVYSGKSNSAVDHTKAALFRGARELLTAARLGSAFVSSLSDLVNHQRARAFVGSPRSGYTAIISDMSQMFAGQTREEMVRSKLILDTARHQVHENARRFGGMQSQTMTAYLADRVIHMQGLAVYTQAGKWAHSMEMMGMFNDAKGKAFGELDALQQRYLSRNRITPAEWDQIRAAPSHSLDARAAGILRPNEIEATAGRDLAMKYLEMLINERHVAIPEPTLRVKAYLNANTRPGTFVGELMRSATQFKSFGVTLTMLQAGRFQDEFARGMAEGGTAQAYRSAMGYAIPFVLATTIMGAAIIQLREMLAGRDPRPVGNPSEYDFWRFFMSSALQGGGFGIMGDFLNASGNRFGGGLAGTLAGPIVGEAEFIAKALKGNIDRMGQGKATHVGEDAADIVQRWMPGANFWPTRLATERLFFDQLHRALDPDGYGARNRRLMDMRKRDYGNDYWWGPGKTSADRAPDMSRVLGR